MLLLLFQNLSENEKGLDMKVCLIWSTEEETKVYLFDNVTEVEAEKFKLAHGTCISAEGENEGSHFVNGYLVDKTPIDNCIVNQHVDLIVTVDMAL